MVDVFLIYDNHFQFPGADSLEYLSVEGLKTAVQAGIKEQSDDKMGHCVACLTGEYPVKPNVDISW